MACLHLAFAVFICLGSICCGEVKQSKCDPNPCEHEGQCWPSSLTESGFYCYCGRYYYGQRCEKESVCLTENPCKNDGECYASDYSKLGYSCRCKREYYGPLCEGVSPCVTEQPCQNQGICYADSSVDKKYGCYCTRDFWGTDCTKRNPCLEEKCQNGGSCNFNKYSSKGYDCRCVDGYRGEQCQFKDPCKEGNPCLNNGTCNSYYNSYAKKFNLYCSCPRTHWGDRCEKISPCRDENCLNGGKCYAGPYDRCQCPPDFRGKRCERGYCPKSVRQCEEIVGKGKGRYYGKGPYVGKGKGKGGFAFAAECRSYLNNRYQRITACMNKTFDEIIALRDCNCDVTDMWFGPISNVADRDISVIGMCYMGPLILPTLGCSNQTVSCIQTIMEASSWRHLSPAPCSDEGKKLKDEVKKCVDAYDAGRLQTTGNCAPLQKVISYAAPLVKMAQKIMCSTCDIMEKYKNCTNYIKNTAFFRMTTCDMIEKYSEIKKCFNEKLSADQACASFKDDLIKTGDVYFQRMKTAQQGRCQKIANFLKTRVEEWKCSPFEQYIRN